MRYSDRQTKKEEVSKYLFFAAADKDSNDLSILIYKDSNYLSILI